MRNVSYKLNLQLQRLVLIALSLCLVSTLSGQETKTDAFSSAAGKIASPNFNTDFIAGQSSPTDIIQSSNFREIGGFLAFSFEAATPEPPFLAFRVERSTGDVFAQGSFIPGGADIAERINVSERVEPGDVVELDPTKPGHYRKARGGANLVAGVITTEPGFVLGNSNQLLESEKAERPLLALMGKVPVKVTTENGPIRPGDLLTVSSKPGYAMRCAESKAQERAIIGKALEGLEKGEGLILVLVMAH